MKSTKKLACWIVGVIAIGVSVVAIGDAAGIPTHYQTIISGALGFVFTSLLPD